VFSIKNRNTQKIASIATAFLLISLFLQLSASAASQSYSSTWMEVGTFAKYSILPPFVDFTNGSIGIPKSDTAVIYSWSCIDISSNLAKVRVSLEYETETSKVNLNTTVYTDTLTGDVYFLNGTLIGSSWLWMQPYPTQNEKHVFLNTPQSNLVGYVDGAGDPPLYYDTHIQEFQKVFAIRGNGTLDGKDVGFFVLLFDFNTGILLSGPPLYDPTFVVLGVKMSAFSQLNLVDTNIDLGPAELSFKIREAIPYVALILAFILITIGIYFSKKRKRRKNTTEQVKKWGFS
jgi:hypothetical protein